MHSQAVTLEGVIGQDGALTLNDKPGLKPGPVRVTVESIGISAEQRLNFQQLTDLIMHFKEQRGESGRTREEIDADVAAMRDEAEEEFLKIERLQEEIARERHDRQQGPAE
jgi:hypothetical protein